MLGKVSNALPYFVRVLHRIDVTNDDTALRRPKIAGEDPQRGGLARTVESKKAHGLAVGNFKRYRSKRPLITVVLADVFSTNHAVSPLCIEEAKGFPTAMRCQAAVTPC